MAQAVAKAVGPRQVMVSSRTREKAEAVAAQLGCAAGENRDLAAQCEYLLLGVKPQVMPSVSTAAASAPSANPPVAAAYAAYSAMPSRKGRKAASFPFAFLSRVRRSSRPMPHTAAPMSATSTLNCRR